MQQYRGQRMRQKERHRVTTVHELYSDKRNDDDYSPLRNVKVTGKGEMLSR